MKREDIQALVTDTKGGARLSCRVQPKASKNALAGIHGAALKISLNAPPVDGKANEALCRFLAELFDLPKSAVSIASGEKNRSKSVHLAGANAAQIIETLLQIPTKK